MLVFPSNPNLGDAHEGWTWNGVKWACAGDGGGFEWPPDGVTDGSNAAPGKVGEVVILFAYLPVMVPFDTSSNNTTQPLPAGDWQIDIVITWNVPVLPSSPWHFRFASDAASTLGYSTFVDWILAGPTMSISNLVTFFVGSVRLNTTVSQPIQVTVTGFQPANLGGPSVGFSCRRVR